MQAPLTNDLRFSVPFQQGRHQPSRAFDFSYSGLKAQVKRYIDANPPQTPLDQSLIAAAFQKAAFTHLLDRVQHAFSKFPDVSTLVVSGGVAANLQLRQLLQQHLEPSRHLVFPPIHLCSDNAAMIGWVALEYIRRGYHGMQMGRDIDLDAIPTWSLNDLKQIAPSEGS
ncbi:hypothetical protein HMI54_011694 [Coelomomyces lativittatus]|nr:hypothetical protein HMI56_000772 [Coelomomyces lativittatus]KAJ1515773.1 hypothetical protein HMI54_011694 [Coelomomyces lativittatus]